MSLCIIAMSGCIKKGNGTSNTSAIIGTNNMTEATGLDPSIANAIGYFKKTGSDIFCNGYFDSSSTVTTAEHCLGIHGGEDPTPAIQGVSFVTAGKTYTVTGVAQLWDSSDVMRVAVQETNSNYLTSVALAAGPLTIYSYTLDQKLTTNGSSTFQDNGDGTFYHQLNTVASGSGSAIFQNGKVVGVHIGAVYSDATKATAVNNLASQPTLVTSASYNTLTTSGAIMNKETSGSHFGDPPDPSSGYQSFWDYQNTSGVPNDGDMVLGRYHDPNSDQLWPVYGCQVRDPAGNAGNTHVGWLTNYSGPWLCVIATNGVPLSWSNYYILKMVPGSAWQATNNALPGNAVWGSFSTNNYGNNINGYVCIATPADAMSDTQLAGELINVTGNWVCSVGFGTQVVNYLNFMTLVH